MTFKQQQQLILRYSSKIINSFIDYDKLNDSKLINKTIKEEGKDDVRKEKTKQKRRQKVVNDVCS